MAPKQQILIGLGSNISPKENLRQAATMLREHLPDIRFSSVYRTAAREVETQEDFLNAVAQATTEKSPEQIHLILQSIEQSLGKAPPYRFGPRTIDLDLLLYGDLISNTKDLILPHPRMHERRFVLEPLCELVDPQTTHPVVKKSWKELFKKTKNQACVKTLVVL
ncbi:2-amino-4-hydroxy-6-hydroxymethyldihydropteridine diphosphokinase [Candidatus Peribacteria bacterium RIFCSPHIGHO2_02_FULL_53_20]|nr:MAG: 2-amino-4-hydroxy-6-hydroxymethyldihydropteridine diphosphokinase [Candidatus Peribacteria bacterium RIFCSPHIGHO2_02_FULL_53_20]OGJ66509.1 MAG: 2-amino-4-hydroxy-6-hydroxymethyldihydropteridine diphosphokinase [Candidatus Peribacteria bacterium RIFCSPLOWO2_01_FULL_53_10]OGJ74722.1 MAG: 2-amino-4-hydroxy-6-hydroxymethyldihydropteridine diphosphokinase [Candidatus Peribacteria bacterium RIFCSPLOWO2_12_FULL_53_10]